MNKFLYFLVFLFILCGIFFRFYNITWGAPYFFNPDERTNVAYPIVSSSSIFMWDQKNFDIGTLPLIFIRNATAALSLVDKNINPHDVASVIFIGRVVSGIFSLGIIVLLYFAGSLLAGKRAGIIAAGLGLFSIGFVQFSHYTTIELWEAFFFLLLFYLNVKIFLHGRIRESIFIGIIFGLALATKLLSIFLSLPILLGLISFLFKKHISLKNRIKKTIFFTAIAFILALCVFTLFSPQVLFYFKDFYGSLHFESQVATGSLPIFYTQSFLRTTPVIFQLFHIYPFLLNPFATVVFFIAFPIFIYIAIKKRSVIYILLSIYFLLLFLSQAVLFVKWTRYMIPTLPFIYLIIAIVMSYWIDVSEKIHTHIAVVSCGILFLLSYVFTGAFFLTVYTHPDTRVVAANYAQAMLPKQSRLLAEAYDPGDIPFKEKFSMEYINTYYLETDTNVRVDTSRKMNTYDALVLLSPRLLRARILDSADFPQGYTFYSNLLSGKNKYQLIYETPCDTLCKLVYLGDPVFSLEETATVFDRPTVFIFKNQNKL